MDRPASFGMNIMNTIDAITIVEGYDAMRIFLETVWQRHGKADEEIEFLVGRLNGPMARRSIRRCGRGGWRPCKSLASVGRMRFPSADRLSPRPAREAAVTFLAI